MAPASTLANSIVADRRKWNARYLTSTGALSLPEPHPMAIRWRARFAGGPMLDAACGLGRGMMAALDFFTPAYGVDVSDVVIFRARRAYAGRIDAAGLQPRWVIGDVTAIPWPPEYFGLVCSFGFTDASFLRRMRMATRPGGMMLYEGFSRRQLDAHPHLNPNWTLGLTDTADLFEGWEVLEIGETDMPPYLVRCAAVRPARG